MFILWKGISYNLYILNIHAKPTFLPTICVVLKNTHSLWGLSTLANYRERKCVLDLNKVHRIHSDKFTDSFQEGKASWGISLWKLWDKLQYVHGNGLRYWSHKDILRQIIPNCVEHIWSLSWNVYFVSGDETGGQYCTSHASGLGMKWRLDLPC